MSASAAVDSAYAAIAANTDYDAGAGSVAKAEAFISAVRTLLALRPNSSSRAGESHGFDHGQLQQQLNRAERWVAQRRQAASGTGTRLLSTRRVGSSGGGA